MAYVNADKQRLESAAEETAQEQPSDAPIIENFTGDEELPKLPQLTSEMRELANRLSDILRDNP